MGAQKHFHVRRGERLAWVGRGNIVLDAGQARSPLVMLTLGAWRVMRRIRLGVCRAAAF